MKKLFTFLLSACLFSVVMAERPTAVIDRVGAVKPVIDGTIDDLWKTITQHDVALPYGTETPTLGAAGTTYWKALFDDKGMYVLVVTNDDVWIPWYKDPATTTEYLFDKVELYFDTNPILTDGSGASAKNGNWQIAPKPTEAKIGGVLIEEAANGKAVKFQYAYKVADPAWTVEYFIPWETIPDGSGNNFVKGSEMGFDVVVVDRDDVATTRSRAVWANVGATGENWANMDDAGYLTFAGEQIINIDDIALTAGPDITTDNGTSQIKIDVLPADHTQGFLLNITGGTGLATIDKDGLVTGLRNGTVKVKAVSADNYAESNEITINISNQIITLDEISILKNGNFTMGANGLEGWGTNAGKALPFKVEDSWCVMNMVTSTNRWDIALSQGFPVVDATTKYMLKFKAKASADMAIDFIIEDTANGYPKNAASTNPLGAASDWQLPLTTKAQWYTFDLTFPQLKANSKYSIGWQGGKHDGDFYIDSVALYKEADGALVGTSSKLIASNQLRVYPNPVGAINELTVSMSEVNAKVAIYNALGQKIMEKVATGNIAKFNVSSLQKGLYFVRLSDGTSQKFIK